MEEEKESYQYGQMRRLKRSSNLEILFCRYEPDGTEYNIFSQQTFVLNKKPPCQGKYHTHDFIELFYVVEGSFEQILLGEKYHFSQGELVITDRKCEHADYITGKKSTVLFLWLKQKYLDDLLTYYDDSKELIRFLFEALREQKNQQSFLHLKLRQGEVEGVKELGCVLEKIVMEFYLKQPGYEEILTGNLIRMFHILCSRYELQMYSLLKEDKEKVILYEIEQFIRNHLRDVTIVKLEEKFHYQRNYYNRLIKKYRGISFREYVLSLRMKQAASLLKTSDKSVKSIAEEVGYENTSFFYHVFERQFHMPPRQYRNERRIKL